ncbi:Poly ADP-ribose polymerase 1, partial [Taenia solium]
RPGPDSNSCYNLYVLRSDRQPRLHLVSRACDRIGADVGGSNVGDSINLDTAVHHFHSPFLYKFGKPWGVKLVNFVRMPCRFYPLGL